MKIAVCSFHVNDWYINIVKYGIRTREIYCNQHGYDLIVDNSIYDQSRDPPWSKIKLLQRYLPDYDYLVWIDADSFIMNFDQKLEHFILNYMNGKDMLFGKDWTSTLCTGVMFVKNSDNSKRLLELCYNNENMLGNNLHEQASFSDLYERNVENAQNNIEILPLHYQNFFLTYWFSYKHYQCFIFHVTRCAHDRPAFKRMMDTFCPIKMDEESDETYEKRKEWLTTPSKYDHTIKYWKMN